MEMVFVAGIAVLGLGFMVTGAFFALGRWITRSVTAELD